MKITLQKYEAEGASHGILVPADEQSAKFVGKLIKNDVVTSDFVKPRNYRFHRKWFALVKFAYEHWQPSHLQDAKWKDVIPEKSFDRFRKDLIIMTGRYDAVYRVDGSVRIEAKSISFASMDEEEFQKLWNSTTTVILDKVLMNYTLDDLKQVVAKLEQFD
tara:strand:+ start:3969 stop:4451 length:483 start_codon:yes stop_codon:yes gene_type:complete